MSYSPKGTREFVVLPVLALWLRIIFVSNCTAGVGWGVTIESPAGCAGRLPADSSPLTQV